MPILRAAIRWTGLALAMLSVGLFHHGHIHMFLNEVAQRLRGRRALAGSTLIQHSSDVQVSFGDPAIHYEVAIHRKTRSLEVGLHFEGERADNVRRLALLANRAAEIRSQLGSRVEFEQWTKRWTRVHDSKILTPPDAEWSPKRDLAGDLAEETAGRLNRFVEVLRPLLNEKRG